MVPFETRLELRADISRGEVVVRCPETRAQSRVRVAQDDGRFHVIGCSRFWGRLRCAVRCEADAVEAFLALTSSPTEPAICGQPNLEALGPREPKRQ